jgi:hypothetical protein
VDLDDDRFSLSADQRLALVREWDELLAEVRALPDFSDFLRPPSYEDLLVASAAGPVVVVNVSRWRCDALIVTPSGVLPVPLPDLSLEEAQDRLRLHLERLEALDHATQRLDAVHAPQSSDDLHSIVAAHRAETAAFAALHAADAALTEICGWLWDVVVTPVLPHLPTSTGREEPRVWWCPTGPLTLLPIHAAGRGMEWLADRVTSSYTPTLRALVNARRAPAETSVGDRFLVASTMHSSSGLTDGPLAQLSDTEVVSRNTADEVLTALPGVRYAHFHCHADQNLQDPAQGGFQLADRTVRVLDLAELSLKGEFAGLAACKTAVGGVELLDESITLATALYYTGFRHVVGSLWNLQGTVAESVFASIYDQLSSSGTFAPTHAARALSTAVKKLRNDGKSPYFWAPFIHIGP